MKNILVAALLFAAPVMAEESHDHAEPEHVFEIGGLEILHPWTNATDHDHALLFMELHNEGDAPVEIIGARLESGLEGQLVGFRMKEGVSGFDPLPPIPVAPGKHLDLTPDGVAIQFDGLAEELAEGHHWEVILLTSAGELEIDVAVEPEDARQHGHAGHSH
ncbi:copper chaperone PCu(A)C [Mameliella sediminis]|uniref:copper chaperone PCu(A)C n=1 Tax=Mameliella sediminis TaxID=2836866 RepID=UPI001C4545A8|nr:copper chaperone PCu(A)C [Mameliella sediminis]MBV7395499.1 copper chaperone PCu(A)C [Mameliella sediminis]MBY6159278.1 copper chaperone PCu(A)C [Mameliella alba]MBY6167749.1 copper chaperone PCu(A)C [Mameliella alba]MBY6172770.1 copper chaperone PCu(A)C [Mameliella alba]